MSKLVGTWNLESSEHFEEYMKELGVGFATRKIGASAKPTIHISQNGNQWTLRLESTFKNSETQFTDGVEYSEETLDGRKCKSVIRTDGPNKLVQEQRDADSGKLATTITREVNDDDKLIQTLVAGSVTAVRTFKRA